jgi:serine/threonine-protein kinase
VKQPAPDVVIAGKYCLENQLAAGGMGSVWIARHLDLDIDVAIKFMDPDCATAEGRIRFEREAKAAACLQSPHVVAVLDYGVDEELPYIVMELLKGEDLEDRLMRQGRLSLDEASRMLSQAAKALRRAQELGIVHRDLKPHNLFLAQGTGGGEDGEEVLKILDFGIAKETGPALVGGATQTGELMGSPHYMSPEHVRGAKDIDFRSDLWSLGVIMFRGLTGRLPFDSDVVGDVIGKILADPIPKPSQITKDLPPAIDDFFERALARDRAQRYQSAKEMAEDLAEIARSPTAPRISRTSFLPGSIKGTSSLAPLSDASDGPRSRASSHGGAQAGGNPAVLKGIAAGAAVVILAGIAVLALARGPSAAEQPPPGATVAPEPGPSAPSTQVAATQTPEIAPTQAAATSPADPAPVKTSAAGPEDTSPTGARTTTRPPGTVPPTKPTASGKKKNWGF